MTVILFDGATAVRTFDSFAFFFFAPSFLSILFGSIYGNAELSAFGYGIMADGAAYFVVHEIIIHRRMTWFKSKGFYLNALVSSHKKHHSNHEKEEGTNFGMLLIPISYFERALRHRSKSASRKTAAR